MPLGASVDEAKEVLRRELQAALDQQNELARRAMLSSGAHFNRAYLVKLRTQLRDLADRQGVTIATGKYSDILAEAFAKGAADGKAALGEVDPAILDLAVNNAEVRVKGILDDGIKIVNEEMVKATLGTTNLADISERLQSKLTLADGGGIEQWRADLIAGSELHSVYRQAQVAAGKANGVEWYEYAGPDDNRTEPICQAYVGEVKTLDEWREISEREQGDPEIIFLYGLHYGCRHTLKPAAPPQGEEQEQEEPQEEPPEGFDAAATEQMQAEEAYARREASFAQAEAEAWQAKPMVEQMMLGEAEAKYLKDWQEAKELETKKKAWKKYGDKKALLAAQKKLDYAKQGYAAAQDAYAQGNTSKSVVTKWKKKYEAAMANAQAKGIATDAPPPAPAPGLTLTPPPGPDPAVAAQELHDAVIKAKTLGDQYIAASLAGDENAKALLSPQVAKAGSDVVAKMNAAKAAGLDQLEITDAATKAYEAQAAAPAPDAQDALVKLNTVADMLDDKITTGTLNALEWKKLKTAAQEAVAAGIDLKDVFPQAMPTWKAPSGKTYVLTAKGTGTAVKGTGPAAPAAAAAPAPTPIVDAGPPMPTDPETILGQKIKEPTGSNTGGVSGSWMGTDGTLRYVKEYANPDQARGEVLANELYRALGVRAPRSTMFQTKDGKWAIATDWQANKGELGKLGITKERAQKVLEGTPVDILLGNRDAVGLSHDNVVFDADGNAWRIDQGGALLFKAQGQEKSSSALATISEWDYFTQGKTYKKVFDAAGVEKTGDIAGVWDKIKQIEDMQATYGSWTNRISMLHPDWDPNLVKKMGDVLDNRTDQLRQKRVEHEAEVRLANAPPAKVTGATGIPMPPGGPTPADTFVQKASMDGGLFHEMKSLGNGYLSFNTYGDAKDIAKDLDAQHVLEVTWQAMKRDYVAGLQRLRTEAKNARTGSNAALAKYGYKIYTAGDYSLMNISTSKAMTNKPMDASEQAMWRYAQAMEKYMGKATGEFVIHRGESSSSPRAFAWGKTMKGAVGKDVKIGQNRFLSTSIKEDVARSWGGFPSKESEARKPKAGRDFERAHRETGYLYEISVKKGCPGIYIAPISSSGQGEYEFIIGTKAKYKFLGMEKIYGGWKIRMEAY